MADKPKPKTVDIEITAAFTVNNRLTVLSRINGEEMNFNFPGAMADDPKGLRQRMKAEYELMKANIVKSQVTRKDTLVGKVSV